MYVMALSEQEAKPGLTVVMVCVLELALALSWASITALMPVIAADLSISHIMGGLIWGALPLGVAIAAPFGGVAADRFGQRRVLAIAAIVGGFATGARALVPDAWSLAFVMLLFGLAIGVMTPCMPKAIAGHLRPEDIGKANGVALLSLTFGNALIVLTAATLLSPFFGGWRPLMLFGAGVMVLVGIIWLMSIPDRIPLSEGTSIGQLLRMGNDKQLMRVTLSQMLQFGGYLVMLGVLPRALTETGMGPASVGIAVALWLGVLGVFNLVGPWLSDLTGQRRPFVLSGSLIAGIGLLIMAFSPPSWFLLLLIVAAIGNGIFGPLLITIPIEMPSVGPQKVGAAIGFMFTLGQVGAFFLSLITGAAADAGGLTATLVVLALIHLFILIPFRGLRETGRKAQPAPAAVG
jgi:cyanate permease